MVKLANSKGKVWYGLHFYPGVAEYSENGKDPFRVFLNEDTLRAMDPTFTGRPVFVMHVDDVSQNIDTLKTEADGWVVESFFNAADGKHWVKFITVSERADRAIRQGMRLSNCYVPKHFGEGGLWNGVSYAKEVTGGEYEHLAIVPNPRYDESVILTPEQFKQYNEEKLVELKKLSNEQRKDKGMLKFFKKAKVENAADLSEMSVVLPKSGKEITLTTLVNEMDMLEEKKKEKQLANMEHEVKMNDGTVCNVGELLAKHDALKSELDAMKGDKKEPDMENKDDKEFAAGDTPSDVVGGEDKTENEDEDEKAKKKALELAAHEEKEIKAKNELEEKRKAKEKADRLRNAPENVTQEPVKVDLPMDQVARGKARYGSGK